MSKSSSSFVAVIALSITVASVSGCSWFHRGNKLYAASAESRPLEVPPELDTTTVAARSAPAGGSTTASATQQAVSQASVGFKVAGSRDEVFNRLGEALAKVEGLTITSRAQLLGAYDVTYSGASFLVRATATEGGVYIAAVDPRGLPVTADAARQLIATLRTSLAP